MMKHDQTDLKRKEGSHEQKRACNNSGVSPFVAATTCARNICQILPAGAHDGFFFFLCCFGLIYCGQFLSALTFLYLLMRLIHKGRGYEIGFILLPVNLINLSLAIYFFATR